VVLPRIFSFMWKGEVAVSSTPKEAAQITALKEGFDISLVITLTEEEPLPDNWFDDDHCTNLFVPVPNYYPPSNDQMDEIIDAIEKVVTGGGTVVVHCGGGKGRAGTVAACLLLKYGSLGIRALNEQSNNKKMPSNFSSSSGMDYIRNIRPGSIETVHQEHFIRKYSNLLWKRGVLPEFDLLKDEDEKPSALPLLESETKTETKSSRRADAKTERENLLAIKRAQNRAPRYIICMGLPGSAKSSFSICLAESSPSDWLVINQDKLGRRE